MPRKKKKPGYNPELSKEELLKVLSKAYGSYDDRKEERHEPSLNALAVEYGLNVLKIRKLLITTGAYSTAASRQIIELASQGIAVDEIASIVGLSKASVNSYLPYVDAPYKLEETSTVSTIQISMRRSRRRSGRKRAHENQKNRCQKSTSCYIMK